MIELEDWEWRDLQDAGAAPIPPKRLWPMCSGNQNLLTGPGLNIQQLNLRECIMQWWGVNVRQGMQAYFKAIPSIIIWELWRRKNTRKHEELRTTWQRSIHNITGSILRLLKVRKPKRKFPNTWLEIVRELQEYRAVIKITKVQWDLPQIGWVKYNTDGASRGNPGASAYAFCLRDENEDLLYAKGEKIEDATNTEAEAIAILEAAKHCKQADSHRIIIQTDSLLLQQVLMMKWECPWSISDMIEQVRELLEGKEVQFQHIMREGNK
ncbi:hypothetical protein KY290_025306 [Solanum tuberosum]|uniref:RNase H type-1 domain-containing protein n=1 Tax=Solanum tuberosum TaxID=4113 RepID=A0ABQ7UT98_SOLTU|nr:hypothetical protein KY290_025306 [Solanum tuberosum]